MRREPWRGSPSALRRASISCSRRSSRSWAPGTPADREIAGKPSWAARVSIARRGPECRLSALLVDARVIVDLEVLGDDERRHSPSLDRVVLRGGDLRGDIRLDDLRAGLVHC